MRVIGAAADEVGLGVDGGEALGVDPAHDALDFCHHLGADAVAGEEQEIVSGHRRAVPVLDPGGIA